MNTDDMLVQQAARNKAQNPTAKVFVYRNIVKVVDMLILHSSNIVTKLDQMSFVHSLIMLDRHFHNYWRRTGVTMVH